MMMTIEGGRLDQGLFMAPTSIRVNENESRSDRQMPTLGLPNAHTITYSTTSDEFISESSPFFNK